MDELDRAYTEHGQTPDHVIVSEDVWNEITFEQLSQSLSESGNLRRGYFGMHVWRSNALGTDLDSAILLSDDVFKDVFGTPKDF
jgi:hypothetical protein